MFVGKSLKGECVACFPPGGQETAAHVSSCSGRAGASPGEQESIGSSYGCINITPILTNEFLEVLGKITRRVAWKAGFLGMSGSSAFVGNAGAGNRFIQCEQRALIMSIMGYTHTVPQENAGKLEEKKTMINNTTSLVERTAKHQVAFGANKAGCLLTSLLF